MKTKKGWEMYIKINQLKERVLAKLKLVKKTLSLQTQGTKIGLVSILHRQAKQSVPFCQGQFGFLVFQSNRYLCYTNRALWGY
ncbi:MAG: hypothetical protein XD78_1835 [Desulfotomaculum sp. 46_296]|nr:MAG: hypothetical protein XD78_1835 [Desulfotomaculum sp. 46_296]HAU32441.1 hypothetical protein [Desulfotomaculum sp.]